MAMNLGVGDALVEQPAVQFLVALDPNPRLEEALAHADRLVLPARMQLPAFVAKSPVLRGSFPCFGAQGNGS
jgi:hypothetical protein